MTPRRQLYFYIFGGRVCGVGGVCSINLGLIKFGEPRCVFPVSLDDPRPYVFFAYCRIFRIALMTVQQWHPPRIAADGQNQSENENENENLNL